MALAFRGLMWGGLLALANPLAPLAIAVPFVATPYLARWFYPNFDSPHFNRWALMEFTCGVFMGVGLWIVS
jgi:hypothetical protein